MDPLSFFTSLPNDLSRKILTYACNSRMYTFTAGQCAVYALVPFTSQLKELFEQDLRTLGVLRATSKTLPVDMRAPHNRYAYYNFVLKVRTVRSLECHRRMLNKTNFPGTPPCHLNTLFKDACCSEQQMGRAIRAAAQNDPDAMKRALKALRISQPQPGPVLVC